MPVSPAITDGSHAPLGVAENTSRTKTVATLMDRPYEPVYTNASAFTDEERAVARAMEKAGWWHA